MALTLFSPGWAPNRVFFGCNGCQEPLAPQCPGRPPTGFLGLYHPPTNLYCNINSIVIEHQQIHTMDIPPTLTHLIALNVEFHVLLCLGNGCRKAVSPAGIVEHLRKKHSTKPEIRKQVQGYIKEFPFTYDYSTVQLPVDRSAPQPIIPIMDGFQCKECPYKTRDRSNIRKHANQIHNKKRIADDEIFDSVRLQSWFQDSRERYWVVDESKQDEQERQAQRANIQDVGEESEESEESEAPSDNEIGQDEINDQIVQEIENWKAEAQERRLRALKNVPVVEMDSWLQYTKWNEVLCQSKHNMIKTLRFTREPDPDEVELSRVLRAWNRILERCLDTLAATDQKDALKWWASPKSEAASQNPFELPQNAKSVEKYSSIIEGFICYAMRTAPANWEDETGELI
jgi:hypothetical protein